MLQPLARALLTCVLSLGLAAQLRADENIPPPVKPEPAAAPDATIHITAKSLSVGVGYSWGKGTLEFQGKTYPVTVDGLLVLAVGISEVNATGRVFNLKSLDDFSGGYEAVRGSSAIGAGGAGAVMRNKKGVEVRMVAENTGVTFTIGDAPVKLAVEK